MAGKLVRWFDLVAPVTAALAKELKVNANKVYVLPGAMEHTAPLVRRRSCRRDMVKVLYAGALERHNGVDKLIKAWKDVPPRFHLFIYGKGSLEKEVTQACKEANNISYMGLASKNKIHTEMLSSDFNVCFRFSSGIDERFFFPSKFFSINCYPGFSLINNFHGVPEKYRELGGLVDNDLNNLACILNKADTYLDNKTAERQGFLYSRYQWSIVLREIL